MEEGGWICSHVRDPFLHRPLVVPGERFRGWVVITVSISDVLRVLGPLGAGISLREPRITWVKAASITPHGIGEMRQRTSLR